MHCPWLEMQIILFSERDLALMSFDLEKSRLQFAPARREKGLKVWMHKSPPPER